ncbi:MAG TPA: IS1182 family transposase [Terracidiphilus sp.]|jgi:transposase|nr:IS1182 family transposase [Terracidiphilus sp.]
MGKSFRADELNQSLLFPPSLHDWLPDNHLARFLADVVNALDLDAIYLSYNEKDGRGMSAYAPAMMVRVLLYGYATGIYSSRKIQAKSYDDVAFRFLSADEHPDHSTLAEFRKRHLHALAGLFTQALQLCVKAGLVKLGHVAIDGTKIKANASKHKAMSYGRMSETELRLKQEVEALLKQAEQTDAAEDAKYGKDKRGDELPDELSRRESRLKKIQQAKAELEQEAAEKAEQERAEAEAKLAARKEKEEKTGKKPRGREPQIPGTGPAQPDAKAQRNFTDSESRIMPDGANKGSFLQGYNAQAAVDSTAQVIVAAEITQQANDSRQLLPMLKQVEANMGRKPDVVSADAGYWSEANATDETVAGIDLHIATGRMKHDQTMTTASGPPPESATPKQAMQHKLRTETGRAVYKRRKAIVEPVFGQIKEQRGFRRFSLRGLEKARAEWKLVCATANLLKLFRYGWAPQAA